jgi:hypothetical protein
MRRLNQMGEGETSGKPAPSEVLGEAADAAHQYRTPPRCRVLLLDHGAGSQIGDAAIFAGDLG